MASDTVYAPGTEITHKTFTHGSDNYFFIDTKPTVRAGDVDLSDLSTGNWVRLAGGISGSTFAGNETSTNNAYLDDDGYQDTNVDGKRPTLAFTGNRKQGDPAQEYVSSIALGLGDSVRTRLIWITSAGQVLVASVTLTAIVPGGGTANAKETFSFTANFNGRPRTVKGTLTMTEKEDSPHVYDISLSDTAPATGQPQGKVVNTATAVTSNTDPSASGSGAGAGTGGSTGTGSGSAPVGGASA